MLQKSLLLILLLILTNLAFAQNSVLDSLENELKTHLKKDTVRARHLISTSNYFTYNEPRKAMKYINEGLEIAKNKGWKKGTSLALNQKGTIYYTMADNLKALDLFLDALRISEDIKDRQLTISLHNNLANIYADMKDYDKALNNYNNCLQISAQLKDTVNQIKALNNIGNVYSETQQTGKSLIYFDKALVLAKALNNTFFLAAIINNKGLTYKRQKDYGNSLNYYNEALRLSQKINNKYIEASALNSLAKVSVLQDRFNQAKTFANKSLIVSKDIDAVEWQSESWQVLHQVYESEKNYNQSLFAFKKHVKLRDSVTTEEKKAELTKKDMQYQLDKQETISQTEIKRQKIIKNSAMAGGGILLLTAVLTGVFYKKRRDDADKIKLSQFEAKVADTELKALRAQMNPHFIFNSLNSINDFIAKNNTKQANDYLVKFSKLTRAILENSDKKWIPLEEEIELSELYMQLESYRLKDKFSYSYTINDKIDKENTLIPPLILQPFIENSIWHGIAPLNGDGSIEIDIKEKNNMLICTIDDNGVGRKASNNKVQPKESKGITITKSRLDILGKGSVDFIDKTKGLTVTLTLPLKHQF